MGNKKKEIHYVTMADLSKKPTNIRFWLKRGDSCLLTSQNVAIGYLRPLTKGEKERPPKSAEFITIDEMRTKLRHDFIGDLLSGDKEYIITYYNDMIGLATSEVPDVAIKAHKDKIRTIEGM